MSLTAALNAAKFVRLVDAHDGRVSLTSAALLIVLIRVAFSPAPGLVDLGALLIGLLAHSGKKMLWQQETIAAARDQDQITKLVAQVNTLSDDLGKVQLASTFKRQ